MPKELIIFLLVLMLPFSNILTGLITHTNTAYNTNVKVNEQWKIFLVKEGTHYLEEKDGRLELVKYPPEEKEIIRVLPSYNSCINCPVCSPPPPQ